MIRSTDGEGSEGKLPPAGQGGHALPAERLVLGWQQYPAVVLPLERTAQQQHLRSAPLVGQRPTGGGAR
jgi:hypothetical protein